MPSVDRLPEDRTCFPRHGCTFAAVSLLSLLIAIFAAGCGSGSSAGNATGDETQQLRKRLAELIRQERAMTAEYPLARNPAPYLVVNLPGRSVDLKAQARTLRSFKIADIGKVTPGAASAGTWTLVDRRPLQTTEHPKIAPGAGEQAVTVAQQAAWGPQRMPVDYDLIFEGGKLLEIRGLPPEESGPRVLRAVRSAYLRTVDRYRHWTASKDTEPNYAVQIWLSENDSQALFWSLPKQLIVLVIG